MSQREAETVSPDASGNGKAEEAPWSPDRVAEARKRRGGQHLAGRVVTLGAVLVACVFVWMMWNAYMGSPWTRDGTVRADVVMVAPEVSGNIVALQVVDNQFVRKGDLLFRIDPVNYRIGLRQADAALRQAEANVRNIDAQFPVEEAQIAAAEAQLRQAQAALTFAQQQSVRYQELQRRHAGTIQNAEQHESQLHQQEAGVLSAQALLKQAQRRKDSLDAQKLSASASVALAQAQRDQAEQNLRRTEVHAPVNGWVTNLLVRNGNFAVAQRNTISIVDADSFWVDGYFEETNISRIRPGARAEIKLMGLNQTITGRVDSIARAINVANAQPNGEGVANVNPIFTWVRLAQRIPVRIRLDPVPSGVALSAGMTATVRVDPTDAPERDSR